MSQPPPYYSQQPGSAGYTPQYHNPYPHQNVYPQGQYQPQPQVIYVDRQPPQRDDSWWLTSLLALCCGCLVGEVCCDSPCLCCVLPCPISLPRFR
uniref:CYSTM domain-containing protein n=1 Tax=Heterorhabditis bacteriophora TaxID=37862 RepID=A0A1I7WMC6_HETBA